MNGGSHLRKKNKNVYKMLHALENKRKYSNDCEIETLYYYILNNSFYIT